MIRAQTINILLVSISDEKPLHMRLKKNVRYFHFSFFVSISDEKPLHMRHLSSLLPDN